MFAKENSILILAAGYGRRMGPYTQSTPKPLLPWQGKPLLYYLLEEIQQSGFTGKVFINSHYLSQQIQKATQAFLASFSIHVLYEKSLLGAGGTIYQLCQQQKSIQKLLVFSADALYPHWASTISSLWQWNLQGEACLFLKEKTKQQKKAPGFLLKEPQKKVSPVVLSSQGKFYYAGVALFLAKRIAALPSFKKHPVELLDLLKQCAFLEGSLAKPLISVGTQKEYEALIKKARL